MTFEEQLAESTKYCEEVLNRYLPAEDEASLPGHYAKTVIDAANYSVLGGGKHLRPLFMAQVNAMYGGRKQLAEPLMAALEMIHNYSLIHDDLPCMDNDRYRRGRLTTHAVYGEGMAVLAGDGLLNWAYETALKAFDVADRDEERERVVAALKVLAGNAGVLGMVGGQCADVEAEDHPDTVDRAKLFYIHKHKTACMIESGFQIGGILAGAPADDLTRLGQIGEDIGVAFQIQDDILDVTSTLEELGKPIGSDEREGKVTYVTLFGLEHSKEDVVSLTEEALSLFDSLSAKNDFLRELIGQLTTRRK